MEEKKYGLSSFAPACNHARESHSNIQINCNIYNNTVYKDREVLLTWKRDVTISLMIFSVTCLLSITMLGTNL